MQKVEYINFEIIPCGGLELGSYASRKSVLIRDRVSSSQFLPIKKVTEVVVRFG